LRELVRLRRDAVLLTGADGALTLRQSRYEVIVDPSSIARRALLLRLAENWLDEDELSRILTSSAGEQGVLQGHILLKRLMAHSWLCRRIQLGERPLLDLVPKGLGATGRPRAEHSQPNTTYYLSRFATAGPGPEGLTLRTPHSLVTVALADPRLAQLIAVAAGEGCQQHTAQKLADLDAQAAQAVLDELLRARILLSATEHEAELDAAPEILWEPEELALHHRSRAGGHVLPIGGTYRFRDRMPPEPLVAPDAATRRVPLPAPDLHQLAATDPTLTAVVDARRTVREHDDAHPITLAQLGEFLYRTQRTWAVTEVDGMELGSRPYPTAGRICELEIYPLISHCAGLDPGLYHYDSVEHALVPVAGKNAHADRMLNFARAASGAPANPQVLLVITLRVPRLMWKYEGIAYTLALKDSGVLTELMYLVATAMGLAPCALGTGDSASFAALSGLDPLIQPSIGDFMLGTRVAGS